MRRSALSARRVFSRCGTIVPFPCAILYHVPNPRRFLFRIIGEYIFRLNVADAVCMMLLLAIRCYFESHFFYLIIVMSEKAKSLINQLLVSAKKEGVSKGDLHKAFKIAMKKQVGHIITLYE